MQRRHWIPARQLHSSPEAAHLTPFDGGLSACRCTASRKMRLILMEPGIVSAGLCALLSFRERAGLIRCKPRKERQPKREREEESMWKGSLCLAALASLFMSGSAFAQEKIKVGVTATLEGTYTVLGEDGIRGFQTALNKIGKKVGD